MKPLNILFTLLILLYLPQVNGKLVAQCKNSIALKKNVNKAKLDKEGTIEVSVASLDEYVCILNIEKGSGPLKIEEKRRKGNSIIRFEGLSLNAIYQIEVEFLSERKSMCRRLQKSQIIFEED